MLDPAARGALLHATRWYQTTASQPAFVKLAGSPTLAAAVAEPLGMAATAARAAAGKAASEQKKADRQAASKGSSPARNVYPSAPPSASC